MSLRIAGGSLGGASAPKQSTTGRSAYTGRTRTRAGTHWWLGGRCAWCGMASHWPGAKDPCPMAEASPRCVHIYTGGKQCSAAVDELGQKCRRHKGEP